MKTKEIILLLKIFEESRTRYLDLLAGKSLDEKARQDAQWKVQLVESQQYELVGRLGFLLFTQDRGYDQEVSEFYKLETKQWFDRHGNLLGEGEMNGREAALAAGIRWYRRSAGHFLISDARTIFGMETKEEVQHPTPVKRWFDTLPSLSEHRGAFVAFADDVIIASKKSAHRATSSLNDLIFEVLRLGRLSENVHFGWVPPAVETHRSEPTPFDVPIPSESQVIR